MFRPPFRWLALAAALPCTLRTSAADDYDQAWRWSHLGAEQGLPSHEVLAVEESADGTLWVGLRRGVAWFDGYEFKRLTSAHGVPPRMVTRLVALPDGDLTFAVGGDLYRGGRDGFAPVDLPAPIYGRLVSAAGDVAVVSRDRRILRLDDGEVREVPRPPGVTTRDILGLDAVAGAIWLRAMTGTYRMQDGHWVVEEEGYRFERVTQTGDGRRYGAVQLPLADRGLWTWKRGGTPRRLEGAEADLLRILAAGPGNRVLAIYESGAVHVGSGNTWHPLDPVPPAMHDVVDARFRRNGDLILATTDGLHLFHAGDGPWQNWQMPQGGARNRVNEILQTQDGDVWLGTDGGVGLRHGDGRLSWFDEAVGQKLRIVTALGEDDEGGVWVASGAYWEGAFRYYNGRWRFYGPEQGLQASRIHRIHRDRDGRLYMLGLGAPKGSTYGEPAVVATFAHGRFGRLDLEPELGSARLHSLAQTPDGAIWVAGARGIGRYRDGTWTRWTTANGLRFNPVFVLAADTSGDVYFGDRRNGLGRVDSQGRVEYFDTRDGLIDDRVWDLEIDGDGVLWVATRGGLSAVRDGLWSNYGTASGLKTLQLWPVTATAAGVAVGSAGQGVYLLDRGKALPPVQIRFEPVSVGEDQVGVRWRALAYQGRAASDRIRTRTALDGGPWSTWSTDHKAVFSGLDAGEHVVQVQAEPVAGARGPGRRSARFRVPPPLYARPLFYLPLSVASLAILAMLAVLVNRRRAAAATLAASERRYRDFFYLSPVPLWEQDHTEAHRCLALLDLPHHASLGEYLRAHPRVVARCARRIRILRANTAAMELFGCDRLGTLARQLPRIFRQESLAYLVEAMVAMQRGATHFAGETTAYTLDGRPLQIIAKWAYTAGTEPGGERVLVSITDVTRERRAAEEQLRAARLAEEASRAKSTFLANTSHEIRTPVNVVVGMAQALQREALEPRLAAQVDAIMQASESLARILDNLLDLSKVEAGQLELESVAYDPVGVVAEACDALRPQATAKGLGLTCRVAPDTVREVEGDPMRVRQVLLNLVGNAVKFTASGRVDVTLTSRVEAAGVRLRVEVRDTGIGISPERLEQVFEPFTQADASISRTHGGTGLGLSISRQLVEKMGGSLGVDSTPGEGSVFFFEVMATTVHGSVTPPAVDQEEPHVAPLRILVAEDQALGRMVIGALLHGGGHQVVEVDNGAGAVEAVRTDSSFDVVLMDVQMPEVDGLSATRQIRRLEAATGRDRLPVIALTADAMKGDRERCLAAGMTDFLFKPVRREALLTALARATSQQAGAPEQADPAPAADRVVTFDLAALEELRGLERYDKSLAASAFISQFLADGADSLARSRQALAAGDSEVLRREVHSLKSAARQVGALELGEDAERLEEEVRQGRTAGLASGLDAVEASFERVSALLADAVRREESTDSG